MKTACCYERAPFLYRPFSRLATLVVSFLLVCAFMVLISGCKKTDHAGEIPVDLQARLPAVPELLGVNAEEFQTRLQQASAIAFSDAPTLESVKELSRLYHANGYLQEAMSCYEVLLALEPEQARWKHLFAFLLSTYGYADDAEGLWKEVIASSPDYVPAKIRLADVYLKSNRLEEANALYAAVKEETPGNPYALLGLARVAIAMENWGDAKNYLEDASRYSDGKIGRDLLVTVYENLGQQHLALMIRGEAKASGSFVDIPDPWLLEVMTDCYDPAQLMNLGGLAAFGGDVKKGIEWSRRAIQIDPENAMAHFQLAQMYYQLNQTAQAFTHFELATRYKPDFSDAWLRMVDIRTQAGEAAKAEELFYAGFMKCPLSPAYNMQYAKRLIDLGDRRQAIGYLKRSVELNPNEAAAYIQLASNYFAMDRMQEGRENLEKALEVEPGNRLALVSLCYYFINCRDQENARKWLDAVESHPRIGAAERLELKLKYQEVF